MRLLPTSYSLDLEGLYQFGHSCREPPLFASEALGPPRSSWGLEESRSFKANHHHNHLCLILSPCSWGDFDCLPKRDNKGWFRVSASTVEAGSLCPIMSFKSQGPLVNRGVLVGVSPLISLGHAPSSLPPSLTKTPSTPAKLLLIQEPKPALLDRSTAKSWGIPAISSLPLSCYCLGPLWSACSYYHPHHPLCKSCCVRHTP